MKERFFLVYVVVVLNCIIKVYEVYFFGSYFNVLGFWDVNWALKDTFDEDIKKYSYIIFDQLDGFL